MGDFPATETQAESITAPPPIVASEENQGTAQAVGPGVEVRRPKKKEPTAAVATPAPSPAPATKGDDEEEEVDTGERRSRPAARVSKELAAVRLGEDASLRQVIDALGPDGSYKIQVKRLEPEQYRDPATKQIIQVGGFLRNYHTPVDEDVLMKNHGGGKFQLQFYRKNERGSWVYFANKTIDVVGDPRTDDTFRNPPATDVHAHVPTAPTENPSLVKSVVDLMALQVDKADKRAAEAAAQARAPIGPTGPDPGMAALVDLLKAQLLESTKQIGELQKELVAMRTAKPEVDPFKEMMLKNLMETDSARITALRAQYDSEIRSLKDNHRDELARARDQFERDRAELKTLHANEITLVKQTHEIQLVTAKSAYETNMKLAESDNRRLDYENKELKSDNKELRAKKEKGPLEIVKEAEQIKDALGAGDGDEKSGWEKAIEAIPEVALAVKEYVKPSQQPQQQQQAAAGGQAIQPKRRVVQTPDGQKWILEADGTLRPVKKKPPEPPKPGPNGEPPIPVIAPESIATIINYLERAYAANQEPEIVAQSGRSMVPAEILTAIRDHGVDGFLSKVAKLPSTSPLSNQAGRNWVRKVGKALVGES